MVKKIARTGRVPPKEIKDKTFEIRGLRNIHRRRGGCKSIFTASNPVYARSEELLKNVIFVCRNNQRLKGKPHLAGNMRCADIAEITAGDDDIEAQVSVACLKANAQPGRNVIHDLRQQTGPIDGVNRTNMPLLFEVGIDIHGFNKILTVIKNAVDCDIDDIVVKEGEHLCALERSHASGGSEHDDAEAQAASERVFCGASGITRGCANDGQPITASSQLIFE